MATEERKFVRVFGNREVHLTACAVTKSPAATSSLMEVANFSSDYFSEPNQFWKRDINHERALLKIYKRDLKENMICDALIKEILRIPMSFLDHDSSDGWGELQFLIKAPTAVKLARNRSFDTRVNKWVEETKTIQPKTDLGTHAYLALRFYHQNHLPPVPDDWHFEPVFVSVRNSKFYKIDVRWEKEEITVTVTSLSKDSPEIPKHLK